MKLCLVCSSSGHFTQMHFLEGLWGEHDRFWVTFPQKATKALLRRERRYWVYFPTHRNLFGAVSVLVRERPDAVLIIGAGVGVPFIYVGRVPGITTVYVESLTRVRGLSLSGKLVYSFVDHLRTSSALCSICSPAFLSLYVLFLDHFPRGAVYPDGVILEEFDIPHIQEGIPDLIIVNTRDLL